VSILSSSPRVFSINRYFYCSGARETEFTGHGVWSHDAPVVMEKASHLNLMTMGLLQTSSYVMEQMQTKVTIDINKFLEAFSIEVDGHRLHPPLWTQSDHDSASIRPNRPIPPASTSTTRVFNMDDYRTSRQAEAICWINLQEKRSSIIDRLQPITADEYQRLRDAVMAESGPLRRTAKKQPGTYPCPTPIFYYIFISATKKTNQTRDSTDTANQKGPNQRKVSFDLLSRRG
jgi:hypothetical protein